MAFEVDACRSGRAVVGMGIGDLRGPCRRTRVLGNHAHWTRVAGAIPADSGCRISGTGFMAGRDDPGSPCPRNVDVDWGTLAAGPRPPPGKSQTRENNVGPCRGIFWTWFRQSSHHGDRPSRSPLVPLAGWPGIPPGIRCRKTQSNRTCLERDFLRGGSLGWCPSGARRRVQGPPPAGFRRDGCCCLSSGF